MHKGMHKGMHKRMHKENVGRLLQVIKNNDFWKQTKSLTITKNIYVLYNETQ